jgi:hypothetical protein
LTLAGGGRRDPVGGGSEEHARELVASRAAQRAATKSLPD